jgi:DNA polymerase III epsilon subunit-like protein
MPAAQTKYPMLSPLPAHYRYALVFDVESTGLLPKINPITKLYPPIDQFPHVIQMSWLIYDMVRNCVVEKCNSYIKLPDGVVISEFITGLTGITNEMCATQGQPIQQVLAEFYSAYSRSHVVVAHNVFFDRSMVRTEMKRHIDELVHILGVSEETLRMFMKDEQNAIMETDVYCTMMATIQLCNIQCEYTPRSKDGIDPEDMETDPISVPPRGYLPRTFVKFPKLSELHQYLFGYVPDNLHNSMMDVLVCLRCFLKIRCCYAIPDMKFAAMTRSML